MAHSDDTANRQPWATPQLRSAEAESTANGIGAFSDYVESTTFSVDA